jgi:hypothetical protein
MTAHPFPPSRNAAHEQTDAAHGHQRRTGPDASTSLAAATEQIPLILLPTDTLTFANGTTGRFGQTTTANTTGLTIRRGAATITIAWATARNASLSSTTRAYFRNAQRRLHVLRIPHTGALTTRIAVS